MAGKKKTTVGVMSPLIQVGAGRGFDGPNRRGTHTVVLGGPMNIWIGSEDPLIDVVGRLYGPGSARPPKPRYDVTPLPGRVSLSRFAGMDLYDQSFPIMFDGGSSSVEKQIRALESLAERTGPNDEPPIVRVVGAIPYATEKSTVRWRIASLEEDVQFTEWSPGGGFRTRMAYTVSLIQHHADKQLQESIRRGKRAKGIANRTTKARAGEYPSDVSRRVFGDPSRASDIVRANPNMRLGQKLKAGQTVRLPK